MIKSILKLLFSTKTERQFPYLVTGAEQDAEIVIRPGHLPNVAVEAVSEKIAIVYVSEHFQKERNFQAILARLHRDSWEYKIIESTTSEIRAKYHLTEQDEFVSSNGDEKNNTNTTYFDSLLALAIKNKASDLRFHIRPILDTCAITHKIDGRLYHIESISGKLGDDIVGHLFTNLVDKNSHEKGKTSFSPTIIDQGCTIMRTIDGSKYKLRYKSVPEADGGYDVSLRVQAQGVKGVVPTLEDINLPPSAVKALKRVSRKKEGAVIATGPVGAGKTTTLYCLLHREKSERNAYVLTVEDPVEYNQYGITRINVEKIGYIQATKAVLRIGPDKLLVGEIRDHEMGKMFNTAQGTGSKVFTTTHTNSAFDIIERLCDEDIQLKRSAVCKTSKISMMFHQRLVPLLCECKLHATEENLDSYYVEQLRRLEVPIEAVRIRNDAGCNKCRGGINGRIPIIEIIEPDEHFMRLMAKEQDYEALDYWRAQCTTHVTEEDIKGKPLIGNALYQIFQGKIDIRDVELEIGTLSDFMPTVIRNKPTLVEVQKHA
ncbi:MAG: ATPase, T2SS/T4P/T4SS family [Candidatus Saccharibacteria bacterium]|nr:ATPase, T2SS/T4P/T4SS family [Candidatus Saccharibacteria bacterium]